MKSCGKNNRWFRKGMSQIMVYKADLISMAAEKDAKEAEILIDSFLNNIRLQDLCSFSIKIPIPQIKNADVLITE